ncbi:class I SAM-dependent methyltransferase [Chungangia koreensis]|uniref:Class I SAM-dependent methyltransferase n=1 Tax=Chungangia koreensis TaxID=752657 RepID=A0ABV8X2R9_9LACT
MQTNVEVIFSFLDKEAVKHSENGEMPYLEGVLLAAEDWLDGQGPDVKTPAKEEVRKGLQLAILKGMKEHSQPHHQMTPDSLGLLLGYLVEQFTKDKEQISLFEPAVGTGNLLFTIMNYLDGKVSTASAVEIDETLIQLTAVSADLLQQPVDLYRQDALQHLLIDPVDAVIADLPYGYYPDDATAAGYELKAKEGMSYAHHLFIEQSIRHTKDGGYLFFLAPASIFESEQATELYSFLKKYTWIQAVFQLPGNMFKNKALEKSILVLQKAGDRGSAPKDVLLGQVPNMSEKQPMAQFFAKVEEWIEENK